MVSRVYTPLVTPYARSQPNGLGRGAGIQGTNEEIKQASQEQQTTLSSEAGDFRRPSAGLQAVQTNQFQKIPLDAVLSDFRNTMNALGADDQTRTEVTTYLRAVSLQGTKEQPEVPFIKHTLRTAAGTLDQFISKALGQPSQVVREWVDALLLQDIDYHTDQPFHDPEAEKAASTTASKTDTATDTAPEPEPSTTLSAKEKVQLKGLIDQAKSSQQAGQSQQADTHLQQALALLTDKEYPDWEGKVWHLRGRFADKSGDWQQAVSAYNNAAEKFSTANLPDKQANALHAMASVLEDHGQLEPAQSAYQQVVALDEQLSNSPGLVRSLNDLGRVYLRQGNADNAVNTLERAARTGQAGNPQDFSASIQSDLFSNLGSAYRSQRDTTQAISAYQQSLQSAKAARDKTRYTSTLQQLATLFIESNQPQQAMKALERLSQLTS